MFTLDMFLSKEQLLSARDQFGNWLKKEKNTQSIKEHKVNQKFADLMGYKDFVTLIGEFDKRNQNSLGLTDTDKKFVAQMKERGINIDLEAHAASYEVLGAIDSLPFGINSYQKSAISDILNKSNDILFDVNHKLHLGKSLTPSLVTILQAANKASSETIDPIFDNSIDKVDTPMKVHLDDESTIPEQWNREQNKLKKLAQKGAEINSQYSRVHRINDPIITNLDEVKAHDKKTNPISASMTASDWKGGAGDSIDFDARFHFNALLSESKGKKDLEVFVYNLLNQSFRLKRTNDVGGYVADCLTKRIDALAFHSVDTNDCGYSYYLSKISDLFQFYGMRRYTLTTFSVTVDHKSLLSWLAVVSPKTFFNVIRRCVNKGNPYTDNLLISLCDNEGNEAKFVTNKGQFHKPITSVDCLEGDVASVTMESNLCTDITDPQPVKMKLNSSEWRMVDRHNMGGEIAFLAITQYKMDKQLVTETLGSIQ